MSESNDSTEDDSENDSTEEYCKENEFQEEKTINENTRFKCR